MLQLTSKLLLVFVLFKSSNGLEVTKTLHSELHEFPINNMSSLMQVLDAMPKECTKNGKTYKTGEEFEIGNLRYKCQDYGVYTIEGCKTKADKPMKLGESFVIDNVKYQCLSHGNSVFYRETVCGILGQPECDKVEPPKSFEEAVKKGKSKELEGTTIVGGVELPKGWKLVDGGSKKIEGTNSKVVTQILVFKPIEKRAKREETGFKGRGIGRVVGVEDMSGGDSGRPQMPLSMLMNGGGKKNNAMTAHGDDGKKKVVSTQDVGARLNVVKSGGKDDTGLEDLHQRIEQKMKDSDKMKPGSVRGSKSSTEWKGKTINVNGKSIAAGPGTFVFGNRPTDGGVFLKKE